MKKSKFDVHEKVRIKSKNIEGVIASCRTIYSNFNGPDDRTETTYMVRLKEDHWQDHSIVHLQTMEYLGKTSTYVKVDEEDLEKVSNQDTLDALRHLINAISDDTHSHLYPETATGTDLDKIAESVGVSKSTQNCEHSWKKYEGFSLTYDYCERCDEKRK